MYLEIITPDKRIFAGEVSSITVPGTSGRFQVLNNHAPIISTLQTGQVKIKSADGEKTFEVKGGVIEVLKNKVVVLAE